MVNASEMIIASLSNIWHLVPIVIAIVLFKKYIDKKDKKRRVKKNEENEKNGLTLEVRILNKYEKLGYKVENNAKDQNIDLICIKDNKTFLFKCDDTSMPKSISEDDIKIFYSNAMKYIKTNDITQKDVELRYAIAYSDVLDKSALVVLNDNSYNCKYVIL